MIGYKVKLKNKGDITSLCYGTEDGGLGQDYISFNYQLLKDNGFFNVIKLVGAIDISDEDEEPVYAYKVMNNIGQVTHIHYDWIAKVEDIDVVGKEVLVTDKVKLNDTYYLVPSTGHINLLSTLPMCACGNYGTIDLGNGKYICTKCNDHLVEPHSYNYRPDYKFIGEQLKADKEHPVWYGLEIEVSTDKNKLGKFMQQYHDKVFLKSDSSIEGNGYRVEIVSHPHSFKELMKKDSWLSNISDVPTNNSDANGCHIHISRTAFKDDTHYSLFYFLLHKMEKIATKVGGRELTDYCRLAPIGKVYRKTKKDRRNPKGRQVYLNEQNEDTVEARFFKGTTDVSRLKSYVQLLESLIKYTRYHYTTVSVYGWFQYITKKSNKYKELLEVVGTLSKDLLAIEVVRKEPTIRKMKIEDVSLKYFKDVVKVIVKSGDTINGYIKEITSEDVYLLDDTSGRVISINIDDIVEVYIEEIL